MLSNAAGLRGTSYSPRCILPTVQGGGSCSRLFWSAFQQLTLACSEVRLAAFLHPPNTDGKSDMCQALGTCRPYRSQETHPLLSRNHQAKRGSWDVHLQAFWESD